MPPCSLRFRGGFGSVGPVPPGASASDQRQLVVVSGLLLFDSFPAAQPRNCSATLRRGRRGQPDRALSDCLKRSTGASSTWTPSPGPAGSATSPPLIASGSLATSSAR